MFTTCKIKLTLANFIQGMNMTQIMPKHKMFGKELSKCFMAKKASQVQSTNVNATRKKSQM